MVTARTFQFHRPPMSGTWRFLPRSSSENASRGLLPLRGITWFSAASGWASRWRPQPLWDQQGYQQLKVPSHFGALGRSCHLGQSEIWWWLLRGPGSAEERGTGEHHSSCNCCNSGRWLCGVMGPSRLWWRQLCSTRSADECAAGSGSEFRFRCNLGWWFCDFMGPPRSWWK